MSTQPRPFVRRLVLVLSGLLLLTLLIHLSAVYLLRYELEQALNPQPGRGSYVGTVELNLFTGTAVIDDIQLGPVDNPNLILSQLAVDVDMGALLQGRLVIDQVDAARGYWRIRRRADGSLVTGLPAFGAHGSSGAKGGAGLPLLLRHAKLEHFNIIYTDHQALAKAQTLRIQRVSLSDLQLPGGRPFPFQVDLRWGGASLHTQGQATIGADPGVRADLQVSHLPLGPLVRLARQPQQLRGVLDTRLQIGLAHRRLKVDGALDLHAAGYTGAGGQLGLQSFSAPALQLALSTAHPKAASISGGPLQLKGLSLARGVDRVALAGLSSAGDWQVDLGRHSFSLHGLTLRLNGLGLAQGANRAALAGAELHLSADRASLSDPRLQGTLQANGLSLNDRLSLAGVQLASSRFGLQQIALGELVLSGLDAQIGRSPTGQWQLPISLPAAGATKAPAKAKAQPGKASAKAPAISVAGLRLSGDNRVHLDDRSTKPPLKLDIRLARLTLGAMSSARPNADTPVDLLLQPDPYTALQLKGQLRPFSPGLYLDINGALSDLELKLMNGLVANSLGNRFLGGHINDKFRLKIASHKLDMHNALRLQNVDVEAIKGKEGPPLSMAVALLEGPNGAIDLQVPISGDLNDPNFHVMAALNPIILKAVAGAAALAFQPVGSVLLVGGLLADQALKVSFAPVLFEPRTDRLLKGQTSQVLDLAGKLREKPKLHLRLCPVAAIADRPEHKGKAKKLSAKEKAAQAAAVDAQLLRLGEQRAAQVRRLMLGKGVAKDQLRLCRPEIDSSKTGKPRVEIRL